MKDENDYTILDKVFQGLWFLFILILAVIGTLYIMPPGEW